ncbi:DUF1254 domain-containing protein [Pseudohalioglobus sediminis]|uniref:DUF1254 domain-containing protein n=1 Tax=Pseudohalioglobus sediminis TaxID=2606449 RepID=A0A5B0X6T8_9GAMM|nr:DUF1214 domain-containing protein [Pseudohalioglobus sediminis]KAA1193949.1 DUF1254 domain-containing protein [Pseudohalioglobus sediminis]
MKKRTLIISLVIAAILAGALVINANLAGIVASRQQQNDALIEESMAYHIGTLAYLYAYPIVDMTQQMHNETHRVSDDQQVYAPVNRLHRFPEIVGPDTGGNLRAPNNDTLYYSGWFDISEEPLIIHTPDTQGRYYTIAVTNLYSEVEHIGRRTTGTKQQYFGLTGPNWKGRLPDDVTRISVESEQGWLLGRMLVEGPEDYEAAMALVNDIWLASLSEFTPGQRPAMPPKIKAPATDVINNLEFFSTFHAQLEKLPPRPDEAALMAQFEAIGLSRSQSFDPTTLSEAARRGLERAVVAGKKLVEAATQRTIPDYNGWMISKKIGRYGFDYMHRASVARGGYGNLPEESLYPAMLFDADGELLEGGQVYQLHFAADEMPPVNGFWSLSAYRLTDQQLEENEFQRYSIGDRTKGLRYNTDGSLTLTLQHEKPDDTEANWLPVPAGNYLLVMRLYEPAAAVLEDEYLLPRLQRIEQ